MHPKNKIKTILIVSAIVFVISLILFWLFTVGIGNTSRIAQGFYNPVAFYFGDTSATGTLFRLPWKPDEMTRGPDMPEYTTSSDNQFTESEFENRLAGEDAYDPASGLPDPRTFGNPSPYRGQFTLMRQIDLESDPTKEYIALNAASYSSASISISGWSLQSAVTGTRVIIPLGAAFFVLGSVNNLQPIVMAPGATAILTTGPSPVGISFQENTCTGYLNELQSFTPEISLRCPRSSGALPITAANIRTYGEACIDFASSVEACHFPSSIPDTLSPACRSFITSYFSYNGCVQTYQKSSKFSLPSWRIYFGSRGELWQNTHDVIRLLDEKGQVVDVLTY